MYMLYVCVCVFGCVCACVCVSGLSQVSKVNVNPQIHANPQILNQEFLWSPGSAASDVQVYPFAMLVRVLALLRFLGECVPPKKVTRPKLAFPFVSMVPPLLVL